MLRVLGVAAFQLAWGRAQEAPTDPYQTREHPLSADESYLETYLEELLDYRDNPIARRYIALADLLDAVPTFIEDIFIPLVIPGSSLTIPVDKEIPFNIPIGPVKIPLPLSFTLVNVTLNDLNDFKKLRPAKLVDDGKFTWHSVIEMSKLDIVVAAKMMVLGQPIDISVSMPLKDPSIDMTTIVAFNRTRLCEVWGDVMRGSLECAVWPLGSHESAGVSGVNMTALQITVSDFDFNMQVHGLGINTTALQEELEKALQTIKPTLIANLPGLISQAIRGFANDAFLHKIPKFQRDSPCEKVPEAAPAQAINVSRMCISNNAGFDLKWKSHNCPAHLVSSETSAYPIDQTRCMDVGEIFPQAVEGETLRVATEAVAGIHEIIDPTLRYVPNTNVAGFECSGTTLDYKCRFVSVAPVDPSAMPRVHKVCIINQAGFVMYYEVKNIRTQNWVAQTDRYPIDQKKCINLGKTDAVMEGDEFKAKVHAIAGKKNAVDRNVLYSDNGLTATYVCTGTTLNYKCKLMVGLDSDDESLLVV